MPSQGVKRRKNIRKAQAKKAAKKAAKTQASPATDTGEGIIITEDDLLAFQLSHFGDDTKPIVWFVDPGTALNYDLDFELEEEEQEQEEEKEEEEEDGLGYYEDGTKRTLTDDQIAMFRHTECEELLRAQRLLKGDVEEIPDSHHVSNGTAIMQSPASNVSSIEGDVSEVLRNGTTLRSPSAERGPSSQIIRSETPQSTNSLKPQRKGEVPYDLRHKRKWEHHIEDNDAIEGSRTHRRIVREMDDLHDHKVELDY